MKRFVNVVWTVFAAAGGTTLALDWVLHIDDAFVSAVVSGALALWFWPVRPFLPSDAQKVAA